MKRKKPLVITAKFSSQEMNYLDSALRLSIVDSEKFVRDFDGGGNSKYLLWFTKRLRRKLTRLHEASRRKWMGEKRWKESRAMINKLLRKAKAKR